VHEIEIQLFVESSVDCIRRSDQQKSVAIGGRTRDRLGGDIAGGARLILDHE
jgi:hypothetical protein